MRRRRVTVVLNKLDFDAGEEQLGYFSEWTHVGDLSSDEIGVTITWGNDPYTSFIPWGSVLRVDEAPCGCIECEREAATS